MIFKQPPPKLQSRDAPAGEQPPVSNFLTPCKYQSIESFIYCAKLENKKKTKRKLFYRQLSR